MTLQELEIIILEHCYDMTILKRDAGQKKKDSILDSIISAIIRSNTSFEDFVLFISDIKKGNVLNIDFFDKGGNINDYINPKWKEITRTLFRQRSVGLGTPNAASGEGELMFLFISSDIKKPTRGDLLVNGKNIEIKGEGVRVTGNISGKNFRKLTLEICDKYKLNPNISNKTNLKSVEIEKTQHEEHWKKELNKLSRNDQISFVSEYLKCIDDDNHTSTPLFDEELNFEKLRKEIVKMLYSSMIKERSFDKFIILGDGTNVKILDNNIEKFNENIDNGNIKILSDYFRINQDTNIGWYIS